MVNWINADISVQTSRNAITTFGCVHSTSLAERHTAIKGMQCCYV